MSHEPWSDERVDRLTRLWRDGLSASEVAAQLGSVTRNAVLGKVHRLGLSGRRPAPKRAASTPKQPRPRRSRPPSISRAGRPPEAPFVEGPGAVADVVRLAPRMCRWPIGDPKAANFTFCGAPCQGVYCGPHRARAYLRVVACDGDRSAA